MTLFNVFGIIVYLQKEADQRAQYRLDTLHSRVSQTTKNHPHITVTPDFSTASREGTVLTPMADQEIQDVLDREDIESASGSRSGTYSRSVKSPGSESETASGAGSGDLADTEAETVSVITDRSRSAMSRIVEEEDEEDNGDDNIRHTKSAGSAEQLSSSNSSQKRNIVLGEKQTYVEITSRQDETDSNDVVKIKYESPAVIEKTADTPVKAESTAVEEKTAEELE